MLFGVLMGFAAATAQSISYLFGKRYSRRFPDRSLNLLALSHIWMGSFAFVGFFLLLPDQWPAWNELAGPLAAAVGFYLMGQLFLFLALQTSDASRVAPLLGLKILILVIIGLLFRGQSFTFWQFVAVFFSLTAAWLLSETGGRLKPVAWLWILLACAHYSIADISIRTVVLEFDYLGLAHASMFSSCLAFLICGMIGLILKLFIPKPQKGEWRIAFPFAVMWFLAMFFLYSCFGAIGVVFGGIVQASRGVISIVMGSIVSNLGFVHIESDTGHRIFLLRLSAGLLMFGAIALFYWQNIG
jgi:drug/metabolite transporter (DMT)-like permease